VQYCVGLDCIWIGTLLRFPLYSPKLYKKEKEREKEKMRNVFLLFASYATATYQASLEFRIENAMPKGNILDLKFASRITLPYGPDLYPDDPSDNNEENQQQQPYQGYGFAMGAAEAIEYDHLQHYLYSMSDAGYIIIADYQDPKTPKLTKFSFPAQDSSLGSIQICPTQNRLFVSRSDDGLVDVYTLVQRDDPQTPTLLRSLETGHDAKNVLASADCDLLVIANTNSGDGLDQGSVTIIQNILNATSSTTTDDEDEDEDNTIKSTTIPLDYNEWDDEYLLTRGLNMPLTKKALEYWDDHSADADDHDFREIRQNYKPAIFLEPENLAWNGPSESELLVNLQENNGLLRINMTDLTAVAVAGYGLKDHSVVPVDINDNDMECRLKRYPSLFAMRNPDTIQTLKYNDKHYVITANEGSPKDYMDWSEDINSDDLFDVCIVYT
jgi:hypothetical protein